MFGRSATPKPYADGGAKSKHRLGKHLRLCSLSGNVTVKRPGEHLMYAGALRSPQSSRAVVATPKRPAAVADRLSRRWPRSLNVDQPRNLVKTVTVE
jgi:hypothetical protein